MQVREGQPSAWMPKTALCHFERSREISYCYSMKNRDAEFDVAFPNFRLRTAVDVFFILGKYFPVAFSPAKSAIIPIQRFSERRDTSIDLCCDPLRARGE